MNHDTNNLESVLLFLTHEYGLEILAGMGKIPGKHDILRFLPDFFRRPAHKADYSIPKIMHCEGILKDLVALKLSDNFRGRERSRLQRQHSTKRSSTERIF